MRPPISLVASTATSLSMRLVVPRSSWTPRVTGTMVEAVKEHGDSKMGHLIIPKHKISLGRLVFRKPQLIVLRVVAKTVLVFRGVFREEDFDHTLCLELRGKNIFKLELHPSFFQGRTNLYPKAPQGSFPDKPQFQGFSGGHPGPCSSQGVSRKEMDDEHGIIAWSKEGRA